MDAEYKAIITRLCTTLSRSDYIELVMEATKDQYQSWNGDNILGFLNRYHVLDLNSGEPPLITGVVSGSQYAVTHMIRQGYDINIADDNGRTPLTAAIEHLDVEMVRLLLEEGADPNGAGGGHLQTPIIQALRAICIEIVDLLIDYKCDLRRPSQLGHYPTHYVITMRELDREALLKKILNHGASFEDENLSQETPSLSAVRFDDVETIQILMNRGLNRDRYWKKGMHHAVRRSSEAVFQFLLDKGYKAREAIVDGVTVGEIAFQTVSWPFLFYTLVERATPFLDPSFNFLEIDTHNPSVTFIYGYHIQATIAGLVGQAISLTERELDRFIAVVREQNIMQKMNDAIRLGNILSRHIIKDWRIVKSDWEEI
ncbi:hypothetical protein QAD02_019288 [Eretmocerus hayati]|uniref:Uncharacterized protein n=1 Tax=Eretmocerus hayati TaxID=131215 RepID=A0ACC2PJ62_9HYME|nr:hypothetical protein QAD02_019288 [Eretmocerus hayati]